MLNKQRLAYKIMEMQSEYNELEKTASMQQEELDSFQKRAMAEEILLRARQAPGAPDKLKTVGIEDFISKRAQLETATDEYLQKVATVIDLCETDEDLALSDYVDDSEPRDFNEWLMSKA